MMGGGEDCLTGGSDRVGGERGCVTAGSDRDGGGG